MHALDRIFERYLKISGYAVQAVAIGALVVMVAVNALEVGWRAVNGGSIIWAQELSLIIAMYLYFYCYALIAKDQDYIRVVVVLRKLPAGIQAVLAVVLRLLVIAFHATVLWLGIVTLQFASLFTTSVLEWPETVFFLPVPFGAFDILATELIYLVWQLRGRKLPTGDPVHVEI